MTTMHPEHTTVLLHANLSDASQYIQEHLPGFVVSYAGMKSVKKYPRVLCVNANYYTPEKVLGYVVDDIKVTKLATGSTYMPQWYATLIWKLRPKATEQHTQAVTEAYKKVHIPQFLPKPDDDVMITPKYKVGMSKPDPWVDGELDYGVAIQPNPKPFNPVEFGQIPPGADPIDFEKYLYCLRCAAKIADTSQSRFLHNEFHQNVGY